MPINQMPSPYMPQMAQLAGESEADFLARVRRDAEQNVVRPNIKDTPAYDQEWFKQRDEIQKLFEMSPRQLREQGIVPGTRPQGLRIGNKTYG